MGSSNLERLRFKSRTFDGPNKMLECQVPRLGPQGLNLPLCCYIISCIMEKINLLLRASSVDAHTGKTFWTPQDWISKGLNIVKPERNPTKIVHEQIFQGTIIRNQPLRIVSLVFLWKKQTKQTAHTHTHTHTKDSF